MLSFRELKRSGFLGWLLLGLVACGGPTSPGNPPPDGSTASPHSGTLIAEGTGYIHTLELANPAGTWQERTILSVYMAASVVPSQNELLTISDSFGSLATVEVLDLGTFGVKETFTWSNDDSVGRVNGLAASRDGKYLAALLEGYGPPYLEVLDRAGKRAIYSGLDLISDSTMTWTPDNKLVFAFSLEFENDPERWGAIGAIPLERFLAATSPNIDIDLYATFTQAEWDAGITDIALSPDGAQLAYTRGRDLWVMDFVQGAPPHQLTTGPVRIGGAQFSPDGKSIAASAGGAYGLDETYIVPNHRTAPIFIDSGQGAGNEYLTDEATLVEAMLAWLP